MAAHRYWRIWFDKTQGDSFISVGDLQLRSTSGGSNWATGGTPISSANFDSSHTPDKAFDGTATTRWASPSTNANRVGHWLGYDLGPTSSNWQDLAEIVWTARSDVAPNQNVKECRVEWSDNGWWWVRDWALYNVPGWSLGQTRTFTRPAKTNQPYWRMYGLGVAAPANMGLTELEFRTTLGGGQAATGGTVLATSQFNSTTNAMANAFDGTSAVWATVNGDINPAWIGYLFPAPVTIVQMMIKARSDSVPDQAPQRPSLDASADGMVWVVVGQWGTVLWTTINQVVVFTPPSDAELTVAKIADSALTGTDDQLLLAKIGDSALTASGTKLVNAKLAESALTGASPYFTVAKLAMSILINPVYKPVNGGVQIIGG